MFGPSRFFSGTMASADFSQFVVTTHFFFRIRLLHAPVRPPRVRTKSFPSSTCRIYVHRFRVVTGLRPMLRPYPRCPPCMRFLFVRPRVCLQLPSDSTSQWTPLLFSYALPTTGCARDFHPLDFAHAGRTSKTGRLSLPVRLFIPSQQPQRLRSGRRYPQSPSCRRRSSLPRWGRWAAGPERECRTPGPPRPHGSCQRH